MTRTNRELKLIFAVIVVLFAVFLAGPILILLGKSLWDGGLTGEFYASVLSQKGFLPALGNSFAVAGASAAAATLLAFLLAYGVHYTGLPKWEQAAYHLCGHPAHVFAHHYLWLCHHLFLWQAGASSPAFWGGSCLIFTAFSA